MHQRTTGLSDYVPGDFIFTFGSIFNSISGQVVEVNHILQNLRETDGINNAYLHHANSFIKWTISIVRGITVLLKEIIFNQTSHFECNFISFSERSLKSSKALESEKTTFSDELDDFLKILFFLKNFLELCSQGLEFREVVVVVFLQGALVFRI